MRVVVIVPTYNERENLGPLIEALEAEFPRLDHEMRILVVDDRSPDGTADVAREAAARWGNIDLLEGEKHGLGVAYVRGIRAAVDDLGADGVVQMDADFSHDPADVPRLVAALDAGADFVIGSRYVEGGRLADDWGPLRRFVSRLANTGAHVLAGLHGVRDCTNGFRAIRAGLIRRMDLSRAPKGYVILPFLVHQARRAGGRIEEVPVGFANRSHGESKLRLRDITEFATSVWRIRFDRRPPAPPTDGEGVENPASPVSKG